MVNPFTRMPSRTIRIIYTVAALIVFGVAAVNFLRVMVYNVTSNDQCAWEAIEGHPDRLLITDIVPGGVADRAGLEDGDHLLAINGKTFDQSGNAMGIINQMKPGEYATYLVERGGQQLTFQVEILKVFNVAYLAQFLLGLGFLLVGFVVVMTRPQGKIQRMFARYGMLAMLFFGLSFFGGISGWRLAFLGSFVIIAFTFAPATFLDFFFHFPIRRTPRARTVLLWIAHIVGVAAVALLIAGNKIGLPPVAFMALFSVPYVFFLAGHILFIVTYFRRVSPADRPKLRPILIGFAIGGAAITYTMIINTTAPLAIFLTPSLLLPALLIIIVPLTVGYSIFRYRLMDIDLIVKRSLIYGGVTAAVAAIYLLFVLGVGQLVGSLFGESDNRTLSIIAFIIIAFVFDPIKRRMQEGIDRVFYQERYNYQKALLEFSQELPRQMNLEEILNSMVNRISSTMHVDNVGVVLCDRQEGCLSVTKNIPSQCCLFGEEEGGFIALLRQTKAPISLGLLGDELDPVSAKLHGADKQKLARGGVVLAVPMFLQDRLIGTINVGAKKSGKVYSQEDMDLLSTVGSQAAIAIENARLHRSEIEKQRIQEELSIARHIQQGLLPKSNPALPGLEIAGVSIPALTVGGDYYDYIQLGHNKLLVVVADVSGKGMSAALYMSKIQGMIQLAAHMYRTPREMLVEVNRRIYDGIERKSFITMILGLFDLERKEVTICRAGHNKALIGVNGRMVYADMKGIGLGLEPGPIFEHELEEVRQPLLPDSLYFFYSDGLTEAMNTRREQYSEETVSRLVQAERGRSAAQIQQAILSSVEAHRGEAEPHDDITFVIVKSK